MISFKTSYACEGFREMNNCKIVITRCTASCEKGAGAASVQDYTKVMIYPFYCMPRWLPAPLASNFQFM